MTQPRWARVKATLARRQSATKPTAPRSLARTVEMTMRAFSRPWKPSTDATSSLGQVGAAGGAAPGKRKGSRRQCRPALGRRAGPPRRAR
eukprot:CAMPEP_0172606006 /NCGR_PEP_ID=MMETSP1068-20121228/26200_1 /TAXON_ID=35684 /ORGANISM="Pseudopedinella elastica, Strain CCMP716" /LENGTH=89 /DNA_ID=CAMNT_0013408581 /DNA_START=112 /DNA_END=378 /DNA_ORIENTATION=+